VGCRQGVEFCDGFGVWCKTLVDEVAWKSVRGLFLGSVAGA